MAGLLANAWATSSKITRMNNPRSNRKKEHLILALQGSRCSFANYFDDITMDHHCLTEINPGDVDLRGRMCGYATQVPLLINAITGGALVSEHINRNLAILAAKMQIPMAVGSQMAALRNRGLRMTYQVVRKYNPQGLVLANLSAQATIEQARIAVEMLEAQALQLHINPAQEFIMPEGDKIVPGVIDNIAAICATLPVPVLVKEVGFGIGAVQAKVLAEAGVRAVDVSGSGGTNFALIEGRRNESSWWRPFAHWGLPTPLCVADLRMNAPKLEIIASGGVDDGLKAIKCLALGASNVAIAGSLLRALYRGGPQGAEEFLYSYLKQIRVGMALLGASKLKEVEKLPLLITGGLSQLLQARGIEPRLYAKRGK